MKVLSTLVVLAVFFGQGALAVPITARLGIAPAPAPAKGIKVTPPLVKAATAPKTAALPTLTKVSTTKSSAVPATAPAPSPASGTVVSPYSVPMEYLSQSDNFTLLVELLDSAAANLSDALSVSTSAITLLAPTNAGIHATIAKLGLTLDGLTSSNKTVTEVLQYHILPSPLKFADLVQGSAFNTDLYIGKKPAAVDINRSGKTVQVVGDLSTATVTDEGVQTGLTVVYALDGLLVPAVSAFSSLQSS